LDEADAATLARARDVPFDALLRPLVKRPPDTNDVQIRAVDAADFSASPRKQEAVARRSS
jgi:hypothetical protein